MDRYELVRTVASANKTSYKLTESIILEAFDAIAEQLSKRERVTISGFGTFEVKIRAPRLGRNLRTGESVEIPKRRVPVFKPHPKLKKAVDKWN